MKYKLLICCLFACLATKAQHHETGIWLGATQYIGDLTTSNKWFMYEPHAMVGAFYQYHFLKRFALRAQLSYGSLSGSDHHYEEGKPERKRNLHFRTVLFEVAALAIVDILPYNPSNSKQSFTPFVFVGFGGFYFNPQARYDGKWVDLQPLGTEGQGLKGYPEQNKYSRFSLTIPVGIGVKFAFTPELSCTIEMGFRKTFTDYIDDVSGNYATLADLQENNGSLSAALSNRTYDLEGQPIEQAGQARGSVEGTDSYLTLGASLSYRIAAKKIEKRRKYRLKKWM